jgi:hypothetical protein
MIRKGLSGQANADGMTDDIARHFRHDAEQFFADKAALNGYYYGSHLGIYYWPHSNL